MNKRLEMLERLTQAENADPFAWYGLALEYKKLGRISEAISTFDTLRAKSPEYLAMYLMAGQLLIEQDRSSEAKVWFEQGIALALKTGDQKALSELRDALAAI